MSGMLSAISIYVYHIGQLAQYLNAYIYRHTVIGNEYSTQSIVYWTMDTVSQKILMKLGNEYSIPIILGNGYSIPIYTTEIQQWVQYHNIYYIGVWVQYANISSIEHSILYSIRTNILTVMMLARRSGRIKLIWYWRNFTIFSSITTNTRTCVWIDTIFARGTILTKISQAIINVICAIFSRKSNSTGTTITIA